MSSDSDKIPNDGAIREKVWPPREPERKKKSETPTSREPISELEELPLKQEPIDPKAPHPSNIVDTPIPGEDVNEWLKKRGAKPVPFGNEGPTKVTNWGMPPDVVEWLTTRSAEARGGSELIETMISDPELDADTKNMLTRRQAILKDRHKLISAIITLNVDGGYKVNYKGNVYIFM